VLKVSDVTLSYGGEPVLERVSFTVDAGEFVSLVGPSGSGKTSILRAVTNLQKPLSGSVELTTIGQQDIGFLFQDDALLPWRTAEQNVALGLRIRGMATHEALAQARVELARLGLAGFEGRYPRELSGGQRKRVLGHSRARVLLPSGARSVRAGQTAELLAGVVLRTGARAG